MNKQTQKWSGVQYPLKDHNINATLLAIIKMYNKVEKVSDSECSVFGKKTKRNKHTSNQFEIDKIYYSKINDFYELDCSSFEE